MEAHALVRSLGRWSAARGPLHQKLARAVIEAIRQGQVDPGIRLPSERALAQALGLSRTTVVGAYDALREAGWLESRPGSGTWVCARSAVVAAARGAAQAAALAASPLFGLLEHDERGDLVDFALGTPLPLAELPPELFALPADEHAALVRDRMYHPLGLARLRQAIAAQYTRDGLKTRPEQVLVTNGAQHAIALCAGLYLERGDTALIEDPAYFGALDAFRATGARIGTLPVGADGISPAVLRDRITATAARLIYLTPTYQNPTGAVMPAAARKEVAKVVSEMGAPLIDDRTMADLTLEGSPPLPVAAYASEAAILTVGSLSKMMWPGLRVGWVRAPEAIVDRLARLKTAMDLGSPLLTQAIAARLLGMVEEARRLRRRQLRPRRDLLVRLLREHLPEWSFRVPAGGLFIWAKLPEGDARELAQIALRHGVAILAGPSMSAAEEHAGFLRLPFLAEPDTLRAGLRRLAAAWKQYRSGNRQGGRTRVVLV